MQALRQQITQRKVLISLLFLAIIMVVSVIVASRPSSDYLLFIYVRAEPSKEPQVTEVRSGYHSLKECQKAGQMFQISVKGKPTSFARCASGCSLAAETERDCATHD
jgi:hypothetical protein